MAEDALNTVESAVGKKIELQSLVQAAAESLRLIEPWNHARAEHQAVLQIISVVQEQAVAYYHALDLSIKTAEDGYAFSEDGGCLCDFLLDPKYSTEELQEYIKDMKDFARQAHEDAKEMSEVFRSVRQGLNEISSGIPSTVVQVNAQEKVAREKKAAAERISDQAKKMMLVATTGSTFVAAIALGGGFPLFLPAALPIVALVSGVAEASYSRKGKDREVESKACCDALKQIHQAATDLTVLIQHVDMFTDWWLEMDTMLEALETKVGQLRADKIVRLRVKTIKLGWGKVKAEYLDYKLKISKFQDYYPSSRLEGGKSSSSRISSRPQITDGRG